MKSSRKARRAGRGHSPGGRAGGPPAPPAPTQPWPVRPRAWAWPLAGLVTLALAGALFLGSGLAGRGQEPAPAAALAPAPAPALEAARRFDGDRAFELLKKQVACGPRVPGQRGHAACRDLLTAELKKYADQVTLQEFKVRVRGRELPMANVVARWKPEEKGGVLLSAHWDTRPTADMEADPARRRMPIPGANDGASGVAVLLELARLFKQQPPAVPVMIVLFDGEDYGPGVEHMFFGSRHFADHLPPSTPGEGVLLDMVGDRDLRIPQEVYSKQAAPEVMREVYDVASRLGYSRQFPAVEGRAVEDDHLPLIRKGLRVIDLIDFDYPDWERPYWHTLADTPDKCSPASLKAVGEVVGGWVYGKKP